MSKYRYKTEQAKLEEEEMLQFIEFNTVGGKVLKDFVNFSEISLIRSFTTKSFPRFLLKNIIVYKDILVD